MRVWMIAMVCLLMCSAPAAAQDQRIKMRVQTDIDSVLRDVERLVNTTGPALEAEIEAVVREIMAHLPADNDVKGFKDLRDLRAFKSLMDAAHLTTHEVASWIDQSRNLPAEQVSKSTRTLAIGATGTLDLETIAGDITVTAGAVRDVTLDITKKARGRTDADATAALDRVSVDVTTTTGERARVRVTYPSTRGEASSASVSFVVTVPPGVEVRARTTAGNIIVRGVKGEVNAHATSGRIDISGSHVADVGLTVGPIVLTDIDTAANLDVTTVAGDVTLQNVKARRVSVDATASGSITAHGVTADTVILHTLTGLVTFEGPLSRGGRYDLKAFSGDLRFQPTGATGFDLETSTFSGGIHTDPSLQFRNLSMSRTSFNGTYGSGGATVVLKTFSGSVTIGTLKR